MLFRRSIAGKTKKAAVPFVLGPPLGLVSCVGCFMGRERTAALVAAAAVRGHRLGDRVADLAGGWGTPEAGNLGGFNALGKLGGLSFGGVWTQGVGSHGGL